MNDFRIGGEMMESVESPTLEPKRQGGIGDAFGEMIGKMLHETNQAQVEADNKAEQFGKGKAGMVETVLAINKADLSLRLLLEVRNKALEAYREITRAN